MFESGKLGERVILQTNYETMDYGMWKCEWRVDKYWGTPTADSRPYETILGQGNTLLNGGADVLWNRAITLNPATGTSGVVNQAFSSGNAGIGVGASTATSTASQTDLQASSGTTLRWIKGMSTASYPSHTTGTATGARSVQFQSQFTTTEANFAWAEWGIFNDPHSTDSNASIARGRMLNRKVQSLGTKSSAATYESWVVSVHCALN